MIAFDKYGKKWMPVDHKNIGIDDIIVISRTSSIETSSWPGFHNNNGYRGKITSRNRRSLFCCHGEFPIEDQYFYFKLVEYEPYDPNQEPEEDCL